MAANSLYPGYLKLTYVVGTQEHTHVVPVRGAASETTLPSLTDIGKRGGSAITAANAALEYAQKASLVMDTDCNWNAWELWTLATPTADPEFVGLGSLDVDGVQTPAGPEDTMITISLRTTKSGLIRVILMDIPYSTDQVDRTLDTAATTGYEGFINWLLGDANIRIGRDGGWPMQFRGVVTKESDALRRARLF